MSCVDIVMLFSFLKGLPMISRNLEATLTPADVQVVWMVSLAS